MADTKHLMNQLREYFGAVLQSAQLALDEITIEIPRERLHEVCLALRDVFNFEMLIDVCGVDYLDYGISEWQTNKTTSTGFSRGVDTTNTMHVIPWDKPRFAVAYHLLSLQYNYRLRVRTFVEGELLSVATVTDIWASADWFEREAFDLFGIIFDGHPDLRRILTDYGFVGHPFRKDFPLIGNVEVRYDATAQRVIYEPVSIPERILEPKVIRTGGYYEEIKPEIKYD